ncbi:MAG: hypothetical protein JOZ72_09945 [Alphaproteobacteria bacterium]|nr:hypothetical protein [Alphaproteobacteria bacterium]
MAKRSDAQIDRQYKWSMYLKLPPINGYAEVFSVFAGETAYIRAARKIDFSPWALLLPLRVESVALRNAVTGATTSVTAERVRLYKQVPKSYRDGGAAYRARIAVDTTDLEPGLYECIVRDNQGTVSGDIYFNVKPRRFMGRDLCCVLPTFTWQAYNRLAGGSFYSNSLGNVRTITTQRPISRTGDNTIHAALGFLKAFAEAGISFCCVDSMDLHRGLRPGGRAPVTALLTHDEYWSQAMRDEIDRYLKRGGVLMVAAGNVCWWRIEVDGDNLTVDKKQTTYREKKKTGSRASGNQWYQLGQPEERTFVSSYRFGGYATERMAEKPRRRELIAEVEDSAFVDSGSIEIVRPDHPIFEGVVLGPGNRFGGDVPIVYREIDAVPLKADGQVDRMWYDADRIEPNVLATGTVVRGRLFNSLVTRAGIVVEADVAAGHVLHMGSFGWARGLEQKNEAVKRIVLNAVRYCRELADRRRPKEPAKGDPAKRERTRRGSLKA